MKNKNRMICIVACILVVLTIVFESRMMDFKSYSTRILSDGFFIGGLLLLLYGGICFIYEGGIFHPFSYIAHIAKQRMTKASTKDFPRYREYVESKEKKLDMNYKLIFCLSLVLIGIGTLIGVF